MLSFPFLFFSLPWLYFTICWDSSKNTGFKEETVEAPGFVSFVLIRQRHIYIYTVHYFLLGFAHTMHTSQASLREQFESLALICTRLSCYLWQSLLPIWSMNMKIFSPHISTRPPRETPSVSPQKICLWCVFSPLCYLHYIFGSQCLIKMI